MRRDTALAVPLVILAFAIVPAYARVFTGPGWQRPIVLAAVLAVAVAAGVRRLRGGAIAAALAAAFGLAILTYITALPDVGLFPDRTSWGSYLELLGQATSDLRNEPAPVMATAAFTVLLSTATWVVFHVAHEVLVRLRSPGLALIPPIILWSVPLAIPLGQGGELVRALPFLAACGLVLLLGTDDGDPVDRTPRATASGLSVGAAALALVVISPFLLPGYGASAWLDLSGPTDPRGYQPIVDVSERLQRTAERDVLLVRAPDRTYLRLAGLDSFDGSTWRLGPAGDGSYRPVESALFPGDRPLPPEEPALATTSVRVEVEVLDLENIYVPVPYQPVELIGPFRDEMVWSTEGGFVATWNLVEGEAFGSPRVGVTQGVQYAVAAERPTPTVEQLRDVAYDRDTLERWTELPSEYAVLADTAREIYADAGADTVIDQTLALQDWFTTGSRFRYDLDVAPLRGDEALERFVTEDRVGYCEYFASAMAVMLRATGIPARVVVGFLPGEVSLAADEEAGRDLTEFTVKTTDAHAWVEVLFPGFGWVTFEPTPRSDQSQLVPTVEDLAPIENLRERRARELAEQAADPEDTPAPDAPDAQPTPPPLPPEPEPGAQVTDGGAVPVWLVAGLLALAVAAIAGVALLRRRRFHAPAGAPADVRIVTAQRHLLVTARRHGIGRAPQETTAEVVRRWHREGRIDRDGDRFAVLAQAAAFGGDVDDDVAAEAERLVAALEAQLRRSVPRGDRALAPVRLPVDAARGGIQRVTAALASRRGSDAGG